MGIKIIILLPFILNKTYRAWMNHLNDSYMNFELPENVRDVYDAEEFKRYRLYQKESGQLDLIESMVDGTVIFVINQQRSA